MGKRISTWVTVLVLVCFFTSGCYYFSAKKEMRNAEQLLSDLKGKGGERLVPYEYCSAEKFLELSRMEFDEYDYKQSKKFADRATSAAQTGLAEVKKR